MRAALTGGIACGKSALARILNGLGVETLDADDIVHEIIPADERRRLAPIVFADSAARKALEARIHPLVRERLDAWQGEKSSNRRIVESSKQSEIVESKNRKIRMVVVPLLYETGWDRNFDAICCVTSSRETQIARMMETRGYTREAAEARLAAQMSVAEKAARADYVIANDGTLGDLQRAAAAFVDWLERRKTEI